MLTKFASWVLYISSYIPLFFILLINNLIAIYENNINNKSYKINLYIVLGMILVIITGLAVLKFVLKASSTSNENITINNISKSNDSILGYLFSYLVPFMLINTSDIREVITFTLVFIVMGIICVENELIYINPTLYLLGYNMYLLDQNVILISKKDRSNLIRKINVDCAQLSNKVYLDINR